MHAQVRLDGYRQSLQTAEVIADRYGRLFKDGAPVSCNCFRPKSASTSCATTCSPLSGGEPTEHSQRQSCEAGCNPARGYRKHLRRIADLDQTITKAQLDLGRIHVKAPINGTVFLLEGVAERNEARPLLQLIPGDLEAKCISPTTPSASSNPSNRLIFRSPPSAPATTTCCQPP